MSNGPPALPDWTTPASRKRARWPLLVTGGFAALVIGTLAATGLFRSRATVGRPAESAGAVREETRAVFAATAPAAADPDTANFVQVLTRFSDALRAHDLAAGERVVDIDRLFDELMRLDGVPHPPPSAISSTKAGFRRGVLGAFSTSSALSPWDKTDIRLIKHLGGDDAVLTTRLQLRPGLVLPMRFWLHRNGSWRVYDWEDLSIGLRMTSLAGRLASDPTPGLIARIDALKDGLRELNAGNIDSAEKKLSGISTSKLPDDILTALLVARGSALLQLGRTDDALAQLNAAERANADAPMVQLLLSSARNRKKDFAGAERAARRAIDLLGPDGLSSYNLGHALAQQGRTEEAERAARAGLAVDPESEDCMAELAAVLPPAKQAEVGNFFAASQFTRDTFRSLCHLLEKRSTLAAMSSVIGVYEKANGPTIDGDLYNAGEHFLSDDFAAAAKLAMPHLRTTDPYWETAAQIRYLQAMNAAGRALDGYRAAPVPDAAFAYLAPKLDDQPTERVLEELITLHTNNRPQDYLGWQWRGFVSMRDHQYAAADAAYETAMTNCPEAQLANLRRYRAVTWYQLGKVDQAYRELTGGRDGFTRLARLCGLNNDADGLEKLVAAHRAADPNDPALVFRDGCIAFLRYQNADAVVAFRKFRDIAPDHELADATTNYLVRALAREDDQPGLRAEAARLVNSTTTAFSEVLLNAALGDAAQAASAAARFTRETPGEVLLDDKDLITVLARPGRQSVRAAIVAATQPTKNAATQPSPDVGAN